jgi:GntR family transcriptional repressor for pyruvate dehydrogenase complex
MENARRPRPKPELGGGALERRSISEQVANRILSMIKSGNLKSGDRLPTDAQCQTGRERRNQTGAG